jgi:hypothetical protein
MMRSGSDLLVHWRARCGPLPSLQYEGTAEQAGKKVDQATQDAGKKVQAAAASASAAAASAGEKTQATTHEAAANGSAAGQKVGKKVEAGAQQAGDAVNKPSMPPAGPSRMRACRCRRRRRSGVARRRHAGRRLRRRFPFLVALDLGPTQRIPAS